MPLSIYKGHCECQCRHLSRWFNIAEDYGFTGTAGIERLKYDEWYKLNKQGWTRPYEEWLAQTFSEKGARQICGELARCQCCQRHQTNRSNPFC